MNRSTASVQRPSVDLATIAAIGGVLCVFVGALAFQYLTGGILRDLMLRMPGIDKVLHIVGFAVAFGILTMVLRRLIANRALLYGTVAALGLTLGFADETVQAMSPDRNVELADLAADACGLMLAGSIACRSPRWRVALAAVGIAAGSSITYASYVTTRDYFRGVRHESKREYALARQHYLKALDSGVRHAALYNGLGWVEIESGEGNSQAAVRYARIALDMKPDDPDILDTYGWALLHAGRESEALGYLLAAQAKKPRMYCIHYHLGQAYRKLGRPAEARRELERQLQRTPGGPDATRARQALDELDAEERGR